MEELPGLKQDSLEEISIFLMKNWIISLITNLLRIFQQIGSSNTGW